MPTFTASFSPPVHADRASSSTSRNAALIAGSLVFAVTTWAIAACIAVLG